MSNQHSQPFAFAFRQDENGPSKEFFKGTCRLPNDYMADEEDALFRDPSIQPGVLHSIGRGTDGIVFAARIRKDDQTERVALKRYDVARMRAKDRGFTQLLNELRHTSFLLHPNIVKMVDYFYESDVKGCLMSVWLATERMDMSLRHYFVQLQDSDARGESDPRDHRHVCLLFVQLFRALDFLESRGIMHRDLNPKNVGLNAKTFELKILDFGGSGATRSSGEHTTTVVTPLIYQPLEMLDEAKYGCSADVWAVGLIAIEFLGKKLMMPTFEEEHLKDLKQKIKHRIHTVLERPPNSKETPKRLSVELDEAMQTLGPERQWLSKVNLKALLVKVLQLNPQDRLRPSECLMQPYLMEMHERMPDAGLKAADVAGKNKRDEALLMEILRKTSRSV